MARLGVPYPWIDRNSERCSWDEFYQREQDLLEKMEDATLALPEGEIVGALVSFQIADGYAYYYVKSEKPLILEHVPFGDGYRIPGYAIRGLTAKDIRFMVSTTRAMHEIFYGKEGK